MAAGIRERPAVMSRLIAAPALYVAWTVIVSTALYGTYRSDPYVFAFTTMGLAWLTGALALLGLGACCLSRRLRPRDRVVIVVALALAAAAVARALHVLSTFNWA